MSRISGGATPGPYPASSAPTPAADAAQRTVRPSPLVHADAAEIERRFNRLAETRDLNAEPLVPPEVGDHAIALSGHADALKRMLDEMGRIAGIDAAIIHEVKGMVDDAVASARGRQSGDPLGPVRSVALELGADPALYDRVAAGVVAGRVDEAAVDRLLLQMGGSADEIAALFRALGINRDGS